MTIKRIMAAAFAGAFGLGLTLLPRPAQATLEMQKKAKAAGIAAANCLYCHNEKLPKKGAVTHNDRGKWLCEEKDKRKAKAIDVAWLKEYVETK
jgi:mono/diheme cytochrome c family protein